MGTGNFLALFVFFTELIIVSVSMGFIDLKNIDWRVPKSEIGFFIDTDYAGKGITSKALECLLFLL